MAELIFDGTKEFLGGQDSSKDPSNISDISYFSGINVRCEKGSLRPRFGFKMLDINFPSGSLSIGGVAPRSYETIFRSGRFQALIPYVNGVEYGLIIVVAGIIFFYNQRTSDLSIIPIAGGSYLNENTPRLNWAPASRFLVIWDFPNLPVIIENGVARRSDPSVFEIPVSSLGAYNQNRLFIANAGNEFTAGDPTGSLSTPDAPITFFEIAPSAPYAGQFFQISTNYNNDPITAMAFLQSADTSTGIGPLLVSTQNGVYSYQSQIPRAQWESSTFGSNFIFNNGIAGQRAFVNVNSDLFFISSDGQIRTASMSRDEQKRWAKTPLSREVQNWLQYSDKDLIPLGAMGYFSNKIFATANPFRTQALTVQGIPTTDYAYGGLVVLGLENVAQLGTPGQPAWDGLWTGVRPMDITTNNDRCFLMSKDTEFSNQLYEITPGETVDIINGKERYISSRVYTKEYVFSNDFEMKQLHSAQVMLEEIRGDFHLNTRYKPNHATSYTEWFNFKHIAPWRSCKLPTKEALNGLASHSFMYLNFGSPNDYVCNFVTNQFFHTFQKVQLQLNLTGRYWEIHGIQLKAQKMAPQNQTESVCMPFGIKEVPVECTNDWAIPSEDLCRSYQT